MAAFREMAGGRLTEDVNLAVTEVEGSFRRFEEARSLVLRQTDPVLGDKDASGLGEQCRIAEEVVDAVGQEGAFPA